MKICDLLLIIYLFENLLIIFFLLLYLICLFKINYQLNLYILNIVIYIKLKHIKEFSEITKHTDLLNLSQNQNY